MCEWYELDAPLRAELTTRAFSSFPDTSLFSEGSILFSFKIRQLSNENEGWQSDPISPLPTPTKSPKETTSAEQKAEEYRRWDEKGREWLHGFVWFEQRRDRGISRGYMQVS